MADPELPQPVPFPIRIVSEPPPPLPEDVSPSPPLEISGPRTDQFYAAWDKFLSVQPKRAKKSSREAQKLEEEKEKVEETQPDGLHLRANAATSWEQAAAECRAKVAAIVDECKRLNQKYRDAIFDLEASPHCMQSLTGRFPKAVEKIEAPPWIKRVEDIFDEPSFFIDGATATDVHQGSGGDCWFLASLMAVSAKKELIDNLCVARDEKVGVYGFVFYRDGEWIYEVIDDKLYMRVGDDDDIDVVRDWDRDKKEGMNLRHDEDKLKEQLQRGGEALYFSHCKSNETWLPLIEKAYAKAHGDYFAIEGGFASEGIEDLTGGVAVVINPEDIMDKDRFWREQLSQVNDKYLFGGGSKNNASKGFVGGHAYTVLRAFEKDDLKLLKLRNPWGETEWEGDWSDGSKMWTPELMQALEHRFGDDGVFWISYKDFLKHFPSINRVRLFNKDWTITQQWTCVNVPWTVDYLDTKFEITVTEKGPIIIVLSQPDDRYFYGLRGRYLYSLHFRLYKENDDGGRYLVRSMHNSGNETVFTRSVSAELDDIEPGKYSVIFKITAVRTTQSTQEEAILKYAIERKEKLLHVGRRFDYAQTKGNLRAMEKANRKEKRVSRKEKKKGMWKKNRRVAMESRERARMRKKRVDDAMKEKRKVVETKEREKRKKRRARMDERMEEKRRQRQEKESQESKELGESQVSAVTDDSSEGKGGATPITEEAVAIEKENEEGVEVEKNAEAEQGAVGATEVSTAADSKEPGVVDDICADKGDISPTETSDKGKQSEKKRRIGPDSLAKDFSTLNLRRRDTPSTMGRSVSLSRSERADEDSEDYDSPPEILEELEDDDFDWDSDMDGPADSDISARSDASGRRRPGSGVGLDLFADDPWNAVCVLGLRVYAKSDVKIAVIKGSESRED